MPREFPGFSIRNRSLEYELKDKNCTSLTSVRENTTQVDIRWNSLPCKAMFRICKKISRIRNTDVKLTTWVWIPVLQCRRLDGWYPPDWAQLVPLHVAGSWACAGLPAFFSSWAAAVTDPYSLQPYTHCNGVPVDFQFDYQSRLFYHKYRTTGTTLWNETLFIHTFVHTSKFFKTYFLFIPGFFYVIA
jgi:hypothetical protein